MAAENVVAGGKVVDPVLPPEKVDNDPQTNTWPSRNTRVQMGTVQQRNHKITSVR